MDGDEEEELSITLPKHICNELKVLIDPSTASANRTAHIEQKWLPNLQEPSDAFITFSGDVHQAHLPALYAWNSTFRKAYSLLFWIRPRLGDERTAEQEEEDDDDDDEEGSTASKEDSHRRLLYRLSTDTDDANGTGVCVTCSPWKVIVDDDLTVNGDTTSADNSKKTKSRVLQTTLTAYALPFSNPSKMKGGGFLRAGAASSTNFSSWTQQTLELTENTWHLVGCSHAYPYLKRPVWTLSVNGKTAGPNELHYPVLHETRKSHRAMEDCQIFHNITAGGAQVITTTPSHDDQKTASQLQKEASGGGSGPIHQFQLDLASVSIYNDVVPLNVQAILADSGPAFLQQQRGACTLPPVPNWVKGCSLSAGPKVGIPLTVHGLALDVQRLSSSLQFCATASSTRVLGGSTAPQARFTCPYRPQIGRTQDTPRVGLIQPQSVLSGAEHDDDEATVLYITGDCSLTDVLATYLLHHGPEHLHEWTNQYTQHWSLVWSQQQAVIMTVLPFFLALTPPDASLMQDSCRHLYSLYATSHATSSASTTNHLAVALLRMLAALLRTGGSRVHEEVLQNGILHIVASTLRLGLIRAHKLRVAQAQTLPDFLHRVPVWDDVVTSMVVPPHGVPEAIAEAVVDILDACCGPDSKAEFVSELSPALQVRRTSDLALTAVFALGLDWDLWANGSCVTIDAIARKYGGACLTSGYVMRSQMSIQLFLDRSGVMKDCEASLGRLLLPMLLSSLTNNRSITQAEKDIVSMVAALSEASLGSTTADVVLTTLVGVLVWCEVLPPEASKGSVPSGPDEGEKIQVAGRLGRNLLMAQFHDVVAPVLLSRTVFSGEHATGATTWQPHWQKCLLVFSWLASIAGPEGIISAQSTGSLMLASSLAGSLEKAMGNFDIRVSSTLFLPSPNMALWIGASLRNEWSYKDLLADRLHIMMPMLPAIVVSMLTPESHHILSEVLQSVCGALERVFGGVVHSAGRRPVTKATGSSDTIQAAKSYVPHLLVVAMVIEKQLPADSEKKSPITIHAGNSSVLPRDKMTESDAMVASASTEDLAGEIDLTLKEDTMQFLSSCQKSVLRTASCLIVHSLSLGGGGIASPLLHITISTLNEPTFYQTPDEKNNRFEAEDEASCWANRSARNVMCRVISDVIAMSLKREQHWEVWGYEMSSAMVKVCELVEEKKLLEGNNFSDDQVVLLNSLVDVLIYGRDSSGWCQLTLPPLVSAVDVTANSRALLPTLRPCLKSVLGAVRLVAPSQMIELVPPGTASSDVAQVTSLLHRIMVELDATVTAAIVGLGFASARDVALQALVDLRKAIQTHDEEPSRNLLVKIAGELTARYQSERRLRGNALFDAYEDDPTTSQKVAQGSMAVEKLILGNGGVFGQTEQVTFDKPAEQDDFVLFPANDEAGEGTLGFDSLRGLSAALDGWKALQHDTADSAYTEAVSALSPFLDIWDTKEQQKTATADTSQHDNKNGVSPLPVLGSATAADAMSTFFEFAATEKSRQKDVATRFLPAIRSSRVSFSERVCWARFTAIAGDKIQNIWEKAVSDGNRDIRSRLATLPCGPQFSRYLPKYLDMTSDKHAEDNSNSEANTDGETGESRKSTPAEIGELTKNLLDLGNVEIVDITKKEIEEEPDDPDLLTPRASGDTEDVPDMYDEDFEGTNDFETEQNKEDDGAMADDVDELDSEEAKTDYSDLGPAGQSGFTTSSFSTPPDNSTSSLGLMQSAAASMIELHVQNCLHVKPEGNRQCTLLLTSSHLILEYDGHPDGYFEGEILAMAEEADRQRRIAEDSGNTQDADAENLIQRKDEKRQRTRAGMRPKSMRWNLSEISHIYLRRYRLRDSSLELFVIPTGGTSFGGFGLFAPGSSLFIDFGPGHIGKTRRDNAASNIMRRAPPQAVKQWPDRSEQFLYEQLSRVTLGWAEGRISNFDYLLHLNILSGRSYNDICQYPVFPWVSVAGQRYSIRLLTPEQVLSDYTSEEVPSLTDRNNFRDLSKPVGALNPDRLKDFMERFSTFADPSIPPFMYGSHYSTSAGVVLHFLVRMHPFAGLHRQLQSGHFDVADRLFSSVPRTWSMCTGSSAAEVKEITPEWYCNPSFLRNENNFLLGTSQDGEKLGDVTLPPWAKNSPEKFVEVMRAALESDVCSEMLSDWIDLIFGRKQQGPEAIEAHNVFFYLTYYGTVDVASIEDEALRHATELQIAHFGQCPMQLFRRPHVRRIFLGPRSFSFFQVMSAYRQNVRSVVEQGDNLRNRTTSRALLQSVFGEPHFLPFSSAPLSHWVHSSPPPPGPHAPLIAIRLAGTDRCIAIDSRGIYHFFKWAWRADEVPREAGSEPQYFDQGCFVSQRELPRFRVVPRLMRAPRQEETVAVAISKTLFANRAVLLILSDADGIGSLGMQLVDPSKGEIKGEVVVPQVHSGRITCIATDPIGTAAGHGGVGGELALVGSSDGNASLWRFMSSHYLPLRPRACLYGHEGSSIHAVALSSSIHVAVTVSTNKCCVHAIGNGVVSGSFDPPQDVLDMKDCDDITVATTFAETSALAISVQGFIITVCETSIERTEGSARTVVTLNLFTLEGMSMGSKPLESWRGVPHKMYCTPDGTTLVVCCGRGVTFHRVSSCQPLEYLDEFQVSESDDLMLFPNISARDIDFGPALNRPVVAAAACSYGALRLHALPGISAWSERYKKSGISQTVGGALATPARRISNAVRDGFGFAQKAGERGGFLGMSFRKGS